ncbi:MAG: ABC transporter permease, partial [Phycisphaerae bacterium]|nr:ABC transporter permease [Phycisphaerae bacterium]
HCMTYLPLANILHHKLRSLLSAMGIGIGICMLITLTGLTRGSLYEISDRWESVDADLLVYPRVLGENITTTSGAAVSDKQGKLIQASHSDIIEKVVGVFLWQVKLGGQTQTSCCVSRDDLSMFLGGRDFIAGRPFAPKIDWKTFVKNLYNTKTANFTPEQKQDYAMEITEADLAADGWLEMVIDSRLAKAGKYSVGDTVEAAGYKWKITGIVPAGVMTRVFLPHKTGQYLFGLGDMSKSTLLFVKLKPGVKASAGVAAIRSFTLDAVELSQYRAMLVAKWGIMFTYVDAVNAIALIIAFLFVMTTLYTMVLQRTREIAILKSCGASNGFVIRQVLGESWLLTGLGAIIGIALSYLAAWGITNFKPLLTVKISPQWILVGIIAAAIGSVISALYPAWRATKVDMVEALTYE